MGETVLRLLGDAQLRVTDDDGTPRTVSPPPGRITGLLGLLALNAGKVVTIERLVDELWPEEAPDSARATVHVNISRLRRTLEGTGLSVATRSPGYVLQAPQDSIDVHVFVAAGRQARAAASDGDWAEVVRQCEAAQALWRGEPFPATVIPVLELERDRLHLERQELVQLHARGLLELGRADEALPQARWLHAAEPYAEVGAVVLMRSLWEAGRASAALEVYETYRLRLADDLGLDPGPTVAALHLEILRGAEGGTSAAEPPVTEQPPAAPAPSSPGPDDALGLIGRRREVQVLDDVISGVAEHRPAVVFIEGEAGIGKTMLARYAAMRAERDGLRAIWARAVDGMAMPPLSMWRRVLNELGLDPGVSAGSPDPDDAFTFYDSLVDRIFAVVASEPLVVVLDDVQWADDGTLQVLQLLANRMWNERLVIVATRRPHTLPLTAPGATALDRISREQVTRVLHLSPFTSDDLEDAGIPAPDTATLLRRSGGNPFLVQELIRDGAGDSPAATPSVPSGVRAIVQARALALPEQTRQLLDAGAVAGRTFDLSLLAHLFDLTVPEVADALHPAVEGQLLVVDGSPPAWSFQHDLFREALLDLQTPQQRSRAHAGLADALEALHADDPGPFLADLALHRFEAVLGQQSMPAFEACSRAADAAAAELAFDHASHHRSRALATLPRTPENRRLRCTTLISLTRERRRVGDVLGASVALDEAQRVAGALGDDGLIRDAVALLGGPTLWNWRQFDEVDAAAVATLDRLLDTPDEPTMRAQLLGTLGVELYYSDDRARGVDAAREAVALARDAGDVELLGRTLNNLTITTWSPEHATERREAIEETIRLVESGLPSTNEAIARLHRAPLLLREARVGDARADLSRAEWLAPRLNLPELEGQVATQLAGLAMLEGDDEWAEESIDRAYEIFSRTSIWGARWIRQIQRVTLLRERGTLADHLDELLRTASEDAYRMLRWTAVLGLAECGQRTEARAMQNRWGLTRLSDASYWSSDFDDVQAGMVAVLLGVPDPAAARARLARLSGTLAVAGTGLGVWGPVDAVIADLSERMGLHDEAAHQRTAARALLDAVDAELMGTDAVSA